MFVWVKLQEKILHNAYFFYTTDRELSNLSKHDTVKSAILV